MPKFLRMGSQAFFSKYGTYFNEVRNREAVFRCFFDKFAADRSFQVTSNKLPANEHSKALTIARQIQEMNVRISPGKRTEHMVIFEAQSQHIYSESVPMDNALYLSDGDVSQGGLIANSIATHEQSHVFYWHVSQKKAEPLRQAYLKMMALADMRPYPQVSAQTGGIYLRNHVIYTFTERCYGGSGNLAFLNDDELFANTTVNLKYSFEQFAAVQDISDKVNAVRREVAAAVLRIWGNARIFADEVYRHFELPIPKTEKDRQMEQLWHLWEDNRSKAELLKKED